MSNKELMTVGVIVARMQLPNPHKGHKWLVNAVLEKHRSVLIVLGDHGGVRNKKNPLTFLERKIMLEQTFPDQPRIKIIRHIDHPFSHEIWSQKLDVLIANEYPGRDAVIYGGRDSVADPNCKRPYTGSLPTVLLDSPIKMSGTELRAVLTFPNTPDARAAIIWDQQNRPDYMYSTSDLVIWDKQNARVLLTGKNAHSGRLAFMGGHVEKDDHDALDTAERERSEEIKGIRLGELTLLGNMTIDDPRYRDTGDGVLTNLYLAEYLGGEPEAGSDVDFVQWGHIGYLNDILVPWHQGLGNLFIDYLKRKNILQAA